MTLPTHIILGAIIGKLTGNYSLAIAASVAPDIDHFSSYIKSGVVKNLKEFWKTATDTEDPYGDQRGVLHNLVLVIVVSILLIFTFPLSGIVVAIGWLGHIALDALDNSDYWPLYPNKKLNLKGPIKYASLAELVFFILLLGTLVLLLF